MTQTLSMKIETSDLELIQALQNYESDIITVQEPLNKAIGPKEFTIYIDYTKDIYMLRLVLQSFLMYISKYIRHNRTKTKTTAYKAKSDIDMIVILDLFKDILDKVAD